MAYNYFTHINSPNFTRGRSQPIKEIVIHWWGDPKANPSIKNVVDHLCNPLVNKPQSRVSAHYVISGTNREVYHLVNNKDTAWHAKQANPFSIGLELDPRCRDEDYDVAAEVIAKIWQHHGTKLPLKPHRDYVATECPGNYNLNRLYKEAAAKLQEPNAPKVAAKQTGTTSHPFLPARGYFMPGDYGFNIAKMNYWLRITYPLYAPPTVLGDHYGPVTTQVIKEFQQRSKLNGHYSGATDGLVGPLTYQTMRGYGFRG